MSQAELKMKETGEFVNGLFEIVALMASQFKDGVQAKDFEEIVKKLTPEVKQKIVDAYNEIDKMPKELKEAEIVDIIGMLPYVIGGVAQVVKAVQA